MKVIPTVLKKFSEKGSYLIPSKTLIDVDDGRRYTVNNIFFYMGMLDHVLLIGIFLIVKITLLNDIQNS